MTTNARFRLHKCCNCGKMITYQFAICADCEKLFGNSALGWPEWLRWKWNDIQRERRRAYKVYKHEIEEADLESYLDNE